MSRLLHEFEDIYRPANTASGQHHENTPSTQKRFHNKVRDLMQTVDKYGNPFLDDFPELIHLYSRTCLTEAAVEAVRSLEELGRQQDQSFVLRVFEERTASFHDKINKNNISIFKSKPAKSKVIQKARQTQQELSLFGRLFATVHSRKGDLENFFSHEIGLFPPALSELGKLRSG